MCANPEKASHGVGSRYSSNILEIFLSSFEQLNVLDRIFNAFIVFDLEYPEISRSGFFFMRVSFLLLSSLVYL